MTDPKSKPKPVKKDMGTPMYASEDAAALGTNAPGKRVSGKPKKD